MTNQQKKPRSNLRVAGLVLLVSSLAAIAAILLLFAAFLILKASIQPPPPQINVDRDELTNLVDLDLPIASVKWQVFRWPDDSFFPVPDVSTELIAEITLADPNRYTPGAPLTSNWSLAPEFALPWLSDPFKALMKRATKKDDVIARAPNCGEFKSSIKSSGRPVHGFACAASGKVLIRLTLDSPT